MHPYYATHATKEELVREIALRAAIQKIDITHKEIRKYSIGVLRGVLAGRRNITSLKSNFKKPSISLPHRRRFEPRLWWMEQD